MARRPVKPPVPGSSAPSLQQTFWKFGDGQSSSETSWAADTQHGWRTWDLDPQVTPSRTTYQLLKSAIVPRPIALVSTLSDDGIPNLAPFSYFSMVSDNPPLLSIAFSASKRRKDTRENILSTKEFTVSIISEPFVHAANSTSVEAPPDVDEWIISGLTKEPSIDIKPAWVRESAISLECGLFHSYDISPPGRTEITSTLILGLIKRMHAREAVMNETGTIDAGKLRAVSRLGGPTYALVGQGLDIRAPGTGTTLQALKREEYIGSEA